MDKGAQREVKIFLTSFQIKYLDNKRNTQNSLL